MPNVTTMLCCSQNEIGDLKYFKHSIYVIFNFMAKSQITLCELMPCVQNGLLKSLSFIYINHHNRI